jgi:tetratricopeptide (TPR) repeat protein
MECGLLLGASLSRGAAKTSCGWSISCLRGNSGFSTRRIPTTRRSLEAIVVFDTVVAREETFRDRGRKWVAYARRDRGAALKGLGDNTGAAEAYAEAIAALADNDDPHARDVVEDATGSQARVLGGMGRIDDAIALFDALIALPEPRSQSNVATAFSGKVLCLLDRRDFEGAIATADAAIQRFGSSDRKAYRWFVALCLDYKVRALASLGRRDAAAFVAEQIVERFGADLDPDIEKLVAPHAHRLGRGRSRLRFLGLG